MKLWCSHQWVVEHPTNFQTYVRGLRCWKCGQWHHHKVRGEYMVLKFYFDARTFLPLSGYTDQELVEWERMEAREGYHEAEQQKETP